MMKEFGKETGRAFVLTFAILFCLSPARAQQSLGTLRGQVADELGGVIIGANVVATDAAGVEKSATTDEQGRYVFSALAPGRYTVRVNQQGFASTAIRSPPSTTVWATGA